MIQAPNVKEEQTPGYIFSAYFRSLSDAYTLKGVGEKCFSMFCFRSFVQSSNFAVPKTLIYCLSYNFLSSLFSPNSLVG